MKKGNNNKFEHQTHPIYRLHSKISFGQRAADVLTKIVGSWGFILSLSFFLITWIIINGLFLIRYELGKPFDPYPFILLNLILSCLAAAHTPIILMSQNRQSEKDRIKAEYDYKIDKTAEKEIREIKKMLARHIKKSE